MLTASIAAAGVLMEGCALLKGGQFPQAPWLTQEPVVSTSFADADGTGGLPNLYKAVTHPSSSFDDFVKGAIGFGSHPEYNSFAKLKAALGKGVQSLASYLDAKIARNDKRMAGYARMGEHTPFPAEEELKAQQARLRELREALRSQVP